MHIRLRAATALALVALVAPVAGAQVMDEQDMLTRPVRAQVGGQLMYAQPIGEFAEKINQGWGGALHGTLLIGDTGAFGLRFDAGYIGYGRDRTRECLTTSCLIEVDIQTTNNLAYVGVGPQLQVPVGPIQPYVAGQVGWTFLWTQSEVEGSDPDDRPFASTRNFSDNTLSYGGIAGLLVPISRNTRNPVSLDLGARYLRNGRVEYLREGDIIINPGSQPTFDIQRSRADLVTYFIGITVGMR